MGKRAENLSCLLFLAVLGGAAFGLRGCFAETDLQKAVKAKDAATVRRLLAADGHRGATLGEPISPEILALQGIEPGDPASLAVLRAFLEAPPREEGWGTGRRLRGGRLIANETFTPPCSARRSGPCPSYGALELAARTGSPEATQLLLDAGADSRGQVAVDALAWAAEHFENDVAALLLAAGVDPTARSSRGGAFGQVSAAEAAQRAGNQELAARLSASGR
jgi:hypothetical protein